MTSTRQAPRLFAPDPTRFGTFWRQRTWSPLPSDPLERARSRSARIHDAVAGRVLDEIRSKRTSRAAIKAHTGWSTERLSRALNGRIVLSLEDIMLLLESVRIPFSTISWTGSESTLDDLQKLTSRVEFVRELEAALQGEIARIGRAPR